MKSFLQKLGWYLTFFFTGVGVALFIAAKYIGFDKTEIEVKIAKIKNKHNSGSTDIDIPIDIKNAENGAGSEPEGQKLTWKQRRELKKAEKAANKLQKIS